MIKMQDKPQWEPIIATQILDVPVWKEDGYNCVCVCTWMIAVAFE